jgi:hypothetical protein
MRANILLNFRCSKCGTALEVDDKPIWRETLGDEGKNSFMTSPSAFERQAVFKVAPCWRCIEKETMPARMLKDALNALRETTTP